MDFMFAQRDLYWLDHLLPDESRRKKEDTTKILKQKLEQVKPRDAIKLYTLENRLISELLIDFSHLFHCCI